MRYLGEEYDQVTRILACPLSEVVSTLIYVGFVAVVTPVMGLGSPAGADSTLLDITSRVVVPPARDPAVLSQFSAATADTVAALGAVALLWSLPTLTIVVVASRAFAAYYSLQCVIA